MSGKKGGVLFFLGLSQGQKVFETHHHGVLEVLQPFEIPDDDLLEPGNFIPEAQGLVQLLFIFDKVEAGFRMVHNILTLFPAIRGVHSDGRAPRMHRSQVDVNPFRTVFADDRDTLSILNSQRNQGQANFFYLLVVLVPGHIMPDAQFLVTKGHLVSRQLDTGLKHLGDRFTFSNSSYFHEPLP